MQRKVKTRAQRNVDNPPRLRAPGRREQVAARQQQAVALRISGHTYQQISEATGVSLMQAHRDVRRRMADITAQSERDAATLIQIELERLDNVLRTVEPLAKDGNVAAAGVMVRCSESRRRLLGLDAAERVELTGKAGGPIQVDDDSPYAALSTIELMARLENVRARLAATADDELAAMKPGEPLVPVFEEGPAEKYERVLRERNAARRTN